jgi:hypothetical protein
VEAGLELRASYAVILGLVELGSDFWRCCLEALASIRFSVAAFRGGS